MGNSFLELKALWDQGLRGRGSKNDKRMKDDKTNLPDEWRTLLNTASYLYSNYQTRKYSFENELRRKGYEFTRSVVTTGVRRNPNERTKEEERAMRLLEWL